MLPSKEAFAVVVSALGIQNKDNKSEDLWSNNYIELNHSILSVPLLSTVPRLQDNNYPSFAVSCIQNFVDGIDAKRANVHIPCIT